MPSASRWTELGTPHTTHHYQIPLNSSSPLSLIHHYSPFFLLRSLNMSRDTISFTTCFTSTIAFAVSLPWGVGLDADFALTLHSIFGVSISHHGSTILHGLIGWLPYFLSSSLA